MATAKKTDARDVLDSNEGNELSAIAVKSLTNLEVEYSPLLLTIPL